MLMERVGSMYGMDLDLGGRFRAFYLSFFSV